MVETAWTRMLGGSVEYVHGDKYKTRCLRAGDGDEPPLVLLHGLGGHAEAYVKNMTALSEGLPDRSVYALDFIGHGYSSTPEDIDYSAADYIEQITDFLDAIGHDTAHIHGESLGGWIAGRISVEKPGIAESVCLNTAAGLDLLDPSGSDDTPEDSYGHEARQDLLDRTMEMLDGGVEREAVEHRLDWLFVEDPEEELVDIRYEIYQQPELQEIMPTLYETCLSEIVSKQWAFSEEELEGIDVPVLIVHSEHNPDTDKEIIEYASDLIPESTYQLYEHSAHWPQWEEPSRYTEDTIDFLRSIDGT